MVIAMVLLSHQQLTGRKEIIMFVKGSQIYLPREITILWNYFQNMVLFKTYGARQTLSFKEAKNLPPDPGILNQVSCPDITTTQWHYQHTKTFMHEDALFLL